jgi:hypothetical protein
MWGLSNQNLIELAIAVVAGLVIWALISREEDR